MKTGKYLNLGTYQNVRIGYGTIDYKDLKTIYIKFKSWIKPIDNDDYDYIIYRTRKKIKKHLYNNNINLFHKETIVDLNIKSNQIKPNKKSFMDVEITLFTKEYFDIKDTHIQKTLKDTIKNIIDSNFENRKFFNFYSTKN